MKPTEKFARKMSKMFAAPSKEEVAREKSKRIALLKNLISTAHEYKPLTENQKRNHAKSVEGWHKSLKELQ